MPNRRVTSDMCPPAGRGAGLLSGMPRAGRPYDERQIMRAWEAFLTGPDFSGAEDERVRSLIVDSWRRSASSGVNAQGSDAPLTADEEMILQRRRANMDLLEAAMRPFAQLGRLLEGAAAMLILTDRDGVIIDTVGDEATLDGGREIHLEVGGMWDEASAGTNGIGTALWTGEPTFVHAAEHFCAGIKRWTCAGAPVHDPVDNSVLGVVDLSGPSRIFQRHNTAVAAAAARQIERALAERESIERARLLEAFLGGGGRAGAGDGLMILDRKGRVVFARDAPQRMLIDGAERDIEVGGRILDLSEGMTDAEIAGALPEGVRPGGVSPLCIKGEMRGAALIFPRRETSAPTPAARVSASATTRGRHYGVSSILGESARLREAIELTLQVARGDVSILFEGETGVGKELFARLVHQQVAKDPPGPFIAVNCGAISHELFGGELFGHVAGAFTGAAREGKAGKIELADGGVLCLDEIGEMPIDLQPYLLRVLEERAVCRLGDNRRRPVDVRVLAMTNRSLAEDVARGQFRRDLFYRIGAVTVQIPPLRERGDDVEILVRHFNEQASQRSNAGPLRFTDAALAALAAHDWPGNVRELRNLVEMLHLVTPDRLVTPARLPPAILHAARPEAPPAAGRGLKLAERRAILHAIAAEEGNMTRAAVTLGVSRATLYRKLRELGIRRTVAADAPPEGGA